MWNYNLALLFSEIVKKYKEEISIIFDDKVYTYSELDIVSNKLAKLLLSYSYKIGDVICIQGKKCIETYSLIVACWKIGLTYFFIDADSPVKRINLMIKRCKPKLLIAENQFLNVFVLENELKIIKLEDLFNKSAKYSGKIISQNIPGDTIAYIMFTSGSTGEPNGVAVANSSLLHFINWAKDEYDIDKNDVLAGLNPLHFDNSVFDTYASLLNGATLLPMRKSIVQNPNKAFNILEKHNITIWFSVPSLIIYYLRFGTFKKKSLLSLRYIIFGGEGFPKSKLLELYSLFKNRAKLSNVYGPTEATCICSSYQISAKDFNKEEISKLSPLGNIIKNFNYYILDDEYKSVIEGEVGELALAGPHLSKGYFNNKLKTKERFINNPNNQSFFEKIYLTGDLVKINKENKLMYFCGRKDSQIKFMGYRIELGEIESCLNSHKDIFESCVTFGKLANVEQITCFVSTNLDKKDLNIFLANSLPPYMIPRNIIIMDELPKNQNDKIDRLKLAKDYYE